MIPIEDNIPIPEEPKKKRGRPPGSKNKPKFQFHEPKLTPDLPNIDSQKVEQGVIQELKKKTPKWAQREPKVLKEPKFTVIGALNKGVEKQAAVEWEPTESTKEQKEVLKEQLKEVDEWRKICSNLECNHSKIAHKTVGTGKCMITDCKCGEFE